MVVLNRIYTKTGDGGSTGLGDGTRRRKHDPRVEAYGTVDETNSSIGLARAVATDPTLDPMLARIQNDLFDLGADLCVPGKGGDRLRLTDAPMLRLEAEVETMNATLPPLTSFILPGGGDGAAHAHMARTIVRRSERSVIGVDGVNPAVIRYLNRLSDHLFVLARVLNANGSADVLWVPGGA